MNSGWSVLVAVLLVSSLSIVGVTSAAEGPSSDSTVTDITAHEDGSATWTIEIRTALESDADTQEYEAFMEDFNNDPSEELDAFKSRMTNVVTDANTTTDREMNAHNFSAEARIDGYPSQYGVIEFTFEWENFASVENSTLHIGDAFDGQLFIGENEYLRISLPEEYTIETVTPTPDSNATTDTREYALWGGPYEFADGEPSIQATDSDETPEGPTNSNTETESSWILPLLVGGLLLIGLGAYAWVQYNTGDNSPDAAPASTSEEDLVTDEERVLELLDTGERVKQTDIRDELGWSDSKTSRVLSTLEEDGKVEKLRLGRENVVRRTPDNGT